MIKFAIMENLKTDVDEHGLLWLQLKFDEAIDKFYDENVTTFDNEDKTAGNSEDYKKFMNQFLKDSSNISAKIKNVIVSDDMSVTEWHWVFDFKDQGTMEFDQLSLQRWRNGKIYLERHHYRKD